MNVAALTSWALTAAGGATMATLWLRGGGPAQHRRGGSRISPMRLASHFSLAAIGLVLWIAYTATDEVAFGWIAFALLPIAALIGFFMFMTWIAGRHAETAGDRLVEQRFPASVVAAHGILAVCTLALVLIALLLR